LVQLDFADCFVTDRSIRGGKRVRPVTDSDDPNEDREGVDNTKLGPKREEFIQNILPKQMASQIVRCKNKTKMYHLKHYIY
jgi:hypothetical protein